MEKEMEGNSRIASREEEQTKVDAVDATISRVVEVIEGRAGQLKEKGMSSWRFFFGVTNVLVVTYCFCVMPQHFWIIYILEALILFPIRWRHMAAATPLSEVFYLLDFCWISNLLCNFALVVYVIDAYFSFPVISVLMALDFPSVRKTLFCAFFGVSTGPLLCAVGALGNALVFHDPDNTVSVFIHLCPSLLMYTMRWHSEKIVKAWPHHFELDYFYEVDPWRQIYGYAASAYLIWWVLYVLWLLPSLGLPSKGYDTIFHCMMRGSNPIGPVLGWSKEESARRVARNEFTAGSALVYMLFHAVATLLSITTSVACWHSQLFHAAVSLAMALAAIYKGSQLPSPLNDLLPFPRALRTFMTVFALSFAAFP